MKIDMQLKEIKSLLGLSLSQLSTILDISRPTLCALLEGGPPSHSLGFGCRVNNLYVLVSGLSESKAKYIGKFTDRYITCESTVMDTLASDDLNAISFKGMVDTITPNIEALENKKLIKAPHYSSEVVLTV